MKVFLFVCFFFFFFAQLGELVAWKNNMCFWNDAMTFARDTWNNKQFVKTVILNQMYISIVYMYMCMRRLFRMSYAKFMGLCDCLLCVWCIKKLSTCHTLTALALSYTKCQRTNLTTQNAFFLNCKRISWCCNFVSGYTKHGKDGTTNTDISVFVVPSFPCLVYPCVWVH